MNQITVRGITPNIEHRLVHLAKETGQSINKTVIALLNRALGIDNQGPARRKRDLSAFAGTWTKQQADEFSNNTRIFETIDEEIWKNESRV